MSQLSRPAAKNRLLRTNALAAAFVTLAVTVANAGAPFGLPPANAQERPPRPSVLDLFAPRMGSMSEHARPLRLDQVRGSQPTANGATRQLTNSEHRPNSAFVNSLADQV